MYSLETQSGFWNDFWMDHMPMKTGIMSLKWCLPSQD